MPGALRSSDGRGPRVAIHAGNALVARRVVRVLEADGLRASFVEDPGGEHASVETVDVLVVAGDGGPSTAIGRFENEPRRAPIVVVSTGSGPRQVTEALERGAAGFVFEPDLGERLVATVRAVAAGQLAIPAEHRGAVARPVLSPREKQVLAMVVLGFTNQEIANRLHVTETTIKSHLSSAYRKLRVRSRHEATALILSDKTLGLGILTLTGDRRED
jgi:DNA-binding NarL/FixJ family response regulator